MTNEDNKKIMTKDETTIEKKKKRRGRKKKIETILEDTKQTKKRRGRKKKTHLIEETPITQNLEVIEKTNTKEEVKQDKKTLNKYQKAYINKSKKQPTKAKTSKKVSSITTEIVTEKSNVEKPKIRYVGLKEYISLRIKDFKNRKKNKNLDPKTLKALEKEKRRQAYYERLVFNQNLEEQVQKVEKDYSNYNIVIRALVKIYRNAHLIFDAVILLAFATLIIGLFTVEVYETGTIIYVGSLLGFLMLVAICYNGYISGKIFTIILTTGMVIATMNVQKTYDFFGILNKFENEYRTYYVVSIDNSANRTIHNINNKKVGVLESVSDKTTLILNTKLKNVKYLEYENDDALFDAFYKSEFRALIVTENQYKYLKTNPRNGKEIKILHEFKAVAKK